MPTTDAEQPSPHHQLGSKSGHVVRAAVVGLIAGLLAVGFRWALAESENGRANLLAHIRDLPEARYWGWVVLPAVGLVLGSLVGWAVIRFAPEAPGSGIPHVKGVLLHVRQMKWKALLPVKFIGGALGIGAGLSLGREGPTVQMGAAVGHVVGLVLRVPSRSVPQLISCGAGAGLAAAFNAPIAGFLFVIEELHRELSTRTFAGALVAALAADIVARALGGHLPSFHITGYPAIPLSALPAAAFIGVVGALLAVAFNRAILVASAASVTIKRIPRWLLPGLACALCGLVAWWVPEAVGGGHSVAERLLRGQLAWGVLALGGLFLAKFVLTVLAYASGAPGGIFAPMLLLGAIAGAILGAGITTAFPTLGPHTTAFAILGMAALFTGSVRAPLTGIMLIVEMTGNYEQLLALGVTCLVADLTAGTFGDRPIYEALLESDLRRNPPTSDHASTTSPARTLYIGVQRGSKLEGRKIKEAGLPRACLIVGVERAGITLLPEAGTLLLPGDHLTVLIPEDRAESAIEVSRLATGI